jgi:predicted phage-related endonuclease
MNEPLIHDVAQGSEEWLALRAGYRTASEAAAMLGRSPHLTRGDLIRKRALGLDDEIWSVLADRGHDAENAARPVAETAIVEELPPATVTREVDGVRLLASLDGYSRASGITWEHKLWNDPLAAAVSEGFVPPAYRPQLEQGLLVTGASRCLFMVSDGVERAVWCWYESDPTERALLIPGWQQFEADLAAYEHVEMAPAPVASVPDALPALLIDLSGEVRDTNLASYQQVVMARIAAIKTDLQTDQDFADAEAMVGFLTSGEKEIEAALDRAIKQTASVDELFRIARGLKDSMRSKRLELAKLVQARKDTIRAEISHDARRAIEQHCIELAEAIDSRLSGPAVPVDFRERVGAAMKGKRTIVTLRDAAAQVLADTKIAIDAAVRHQMANLKWYDEQGVPGHLFHDLCALVTKPADDFRAAVAARVAKHNESLAAERERVRVEEEERARRLAAEEAARAAAPPERTAEADAGALPPEATPEAPCAPAHAAVEPEPVAPPVEVDPAVPWRVRVIGIEVEVIVGGSRAFLSLDDAVALRDALTQAIRQGRKAA